MAKLEKYLRLDPRGNFDWITIDRDHFYESMCEAIDCDLLELIGLQYGLDCVVDASGPFNSYQRMNPLASRLSAGYGNGHRLFGPVVFVVPGIGPSGDLECSPIYPGHIRILEHRLNVDIPDPEV